MSIFRRMSWFTTFIIPVTVALVIAFAGIVMPGIPRIYFIVAFLAALIFLPGVFIGLKIAKTPATIEKTIMVGLKAENLNIVHLQHPDGSIRAYMDTSLANAYRAGTVKKGQIIKVIIRDDVMLKWDKEDEHAEED
ncbi:MAG: hypothetical protein H0Z39_06195 [Peptococcaceae bacterium]|nr:hypothetical protein [Peptococcaceae bacterium]